VADGWKQFAFVLDVSFMKGRAMTVWGKLMHWRTGFSRACFPVRRRRGWNAGQQVTERLEDRRLLSGSPVLEGVQVISQVEHQVTVTGVASWGTPTDQGVEVYFDFGGNGSCEGLLQLEGGGGQFSQNVTTQGMSGSVTLYVRAEFRDMALGEQSTCWTAVAIELPPAGDGDGYGYGEKRKDDSVGRGRGSKRARMEPTSPIGGRVQDGHVPPIFKRGFPVERSHGPIRRRAESAEPGDRSIDVESGTINGGRLRVIRDGRATIGGESRSPREGGRKTQRNSDEPFFASVYVELMKNNNIRCYGQVQTMDQQGATIQLRGAVGGESMVTDSHGNFDQVFEWQVQTANYVTFQAVDSAGRQSRLRTVTLV
jgi:hypothetical protein